jgi:hypothetical protein
MIYLITDGKNFKVGHTTKNNFENRMRHYITHNPNIELIEYVDTYAKTKHQLETELKHEIEILGYEFITTTVLNMSVKTEWFKVPKSKRKEFFQKGLSQFKACQNRKIIKCVES